MGQTHKTEQFQHLLQVVDLAFQTHTTEQEILLEGNQVQSLQIKVN